MSLEIPFEVLSGGRIPAIDHMHALLQRTNGLFTWENYGIDWVNDHHYSFERMDKDSVEEYFQVNNFMNMKPMTREANWEKGGRGL